MVSQSVLLRGVNDDVATLAALDARLCRDADQAVLPAPSRPRARHGAFSPLDRRRPDAGRGAARRDFRALPADLRARYSRRPRQDADRAEPASARAKRRDARSRTGAASATPIPRAKARASKENPICAGICAPRQPLCAPAPLRPCAAEKSLPSISLMRFLPRVAIRLLPLFAVCLLCFAALAQTNPAPPPQLTPTQRVDQARAALDQIEAALIATRSARHRAQRSARQDRSRSRPAPTRSSRSSRPSSPKSRRVSTSLDRSPPTMRRPKTQWSRPNAAISRSGSPTSTKS